MTYVFPPSKIAFPSPAGGVQIVQWQVNSLYPRKSQFNQTRSIPPSLFHPFLIPSPSFPPLLTLFISLILFPSLSPYLTPFILTYPSQIFHLPLHLTLIHSISPILDPSIPQSFLPFLFLSFPHFPLPFTICYLSPSLHPWYMYHPLPPSILLFLLYWYMYSSILALSHFFSPSCFSYLPPSLHLSLSPFPNRFPSIHPLPRLSSHSFYSKSKTTVADNGLFKNTNQLKFCLVQDSEPSTEQVAHVKSKNKSPTSALGLPLLRHPEKKKETFYSFPFLSILLRLNI